jgi:antirestriction protein ArdC
MIEEIKHNGRHEMTKIDVNQKLTDKIVEMLDAGVVPWHKPWATSPAINAITGRRYKGINVWLLAANTFTDPRWITYNKAKEFGGQVRKGEQATFIVLWSPYTTTKDGEDVTRFFLKYFNVFNIEQIDGMDDSKLVKLQKKNTTVKEAQEAADVIIAEMPNPPKIVYGGDVASYHMATDIVNVPLMETFESADAFYSTHFHELTHSTRGARRLNRDNESNEFGCENYAKEELVAEFGAAFLSAHAGIVTTIANSAAYIANWRTAISDDKTLVMSAASKGDKAANYILGIEEESYA